MSEQRFEQNGMKPVAAGDLQIGQRLTAGLPADLESSRAIAVSLVPIDFGKFQPVELDREILCRKHPDNLSEWKSDHVCV
jgi:hypothetical protein